MRKIIVTEFITLDGVIEAPGGKETNHPHEGWQTSYRSAGGGQYKVDELASVDALLLGRKTYDVFASYWPTAQEEAGAFADRMNALNKYVASTTLQDASWEHSHIIRDVAKEVAALRQSEGGDILVYGSATLVKALLHHHLVDELRLQLYPVTIGGGLRLFDDDRAMKKFQLKNARTVEGGIVLLEYVPASGADA